MPPIAQLARQHPKTAGAGAVFSVLLTAGMTFKQEVPEVIHPSPVIESLRGKWVSNDTGAENARVERELLFYQKADASKNAIRMHLKIRDSGGQLTCDMHYKVHLSKGTEQNNWSYSASFSKEKNVTCNEKQPLDDKGTITLNNNLYLSSTTESGVFGKAEYKKK
jgi:hypothetical protein